MLEVVVNRIAAAGTVTITVIRIDDEKLQAKAVFVSPPDAKTSKLIRKALDQFDAEAARI